MLTITDGSSSEFDTITHSFVNENNGSIQISGAPLITYTGLEPVIDNGDTFNRVFDFTGGDESIFLAPGFVLDLMIDSDLGESVDFNAPTTSISITNSGAGEDVIFLDDISSFYTGPISVSGGEGNDSLIGRLAADNDTAVFSGNLADYTIELDIAGRIVTDNEPMIDGDDGQDFVAGFEILEFADATVRLVGADSAYVFIQDAIDAADSGDIVLIGDGNGTPYLESLQLSDDITLRGSTGDPADVVIDGSTGGPDDGVISIIGSAATAITIEGVTLTNSASRHGVRALTSPSLDLVINNIHATDNNDHPTNTQYGVAVSGINSLTVTDSVFSGNKTGGVGAFPTVGSVTVSGSDFSGQTTANVLRNSGATTFDASGNYLGESYLIDASLAVSSPFAVFGNVDFTTLRDSSLGTDTLYVHDEGTQTGFGGRIAEGIADVEEFGTVVIQDGIYAEDVDVNRAVTLAGAPIIGGTLTLSDSGAILDPGFSPGVIASGDLVVAAGATVEIEIVGTDGPGNVNGHDQLVVTGTVDITGAVLDLQLIGSPVPGSTYVLIDNDGTGDAVTGTFDGFADDVAVLVSVLGGSGTVPVTIDYDGGDGNDVVATVGLPAGAFFVDDSFTPGSPGSGDLVTWTPTNGLYPTPADVPSLVYEFEAFDTIQDATAAAAIAALTTTPLIRSASTAWTVAEQDGGGGVVSTPWISVIEGDFDTIDSYGIAPGFTGAVNVMGGSLKYTTDADFNGAASIQYTVTDGVNFIDGEIWVTVTPVNDAPVAEDDDIDFGEDDVAPAGDLLVDNGNGADADDDDDTLTIEEVNGLPGNVGTPITLTNGVVTVSASGAFSFVPNQTLTDGDVVSDTFTYQLIDDGSPNLSSNVATVTIEVTGANDAPVAVDDDSYAVNEIPGLLTILEPAGLLANDSDVDIGAMLTVTEIDGSAVADGDTVSLTYGDLTINDDGSFDYQVTASIAPGDVVLEEFDYTVSDGIDDATAAVTISITGQNDPPVANDDTFAATEGAAPISGDLFAANPTEQSIPIPMVMASRSLRSMAPRSPTRTPSSIDLRHTDHQRRRYV